MCRMPPIWCHVIETSARTQHIRCRPWLKPRMEVNNIQKIVICRAANQLNLIFCREKKGECLAAAVTATQIGGLSLCKYQKYGGKRTLFDCTQTRLYQIHRATGVFAVGVSRARCLVSVGLSLVCLSVCQRRPHRLPLYLRLNLWTSPFLVYRDCPFCLFHWMWLQLHVAQHTTVHITQFLGIYRCKLITHKHLGMNECCTLHFRTISRMLTQSAASKTDAKLSELCSFVGINLGMDLLIYCNLISVSDCRRRCRIETLCTIGCISSRHHPIAEDKCEKSS